MLNFSFHFNTFQLIFSLLNVAFIFFFCKILVTHFTDIDKKKIEVR